MPRETQQYRHQDAAVQRPEVGVQDQFQARKQPKTYRFDSSLDPALSWDEQRERDLGEWLLGLIDRAAKEGELTVFAQPQVWVGGGVRIASTVEAVDVLKSVSAPFLNWAGKAERHEIEVPTLPLFIHERHSTKAILEGIRHRKARGQSLDLFGDPKLDIRDQLEAYEHKGPWHNRMILGDSLGVMHSLIEFEGLGGQVQMIYFDPPYGVNFGSNFQPFVRKRVVKSGRDKDLTREPEMVRAYRDTWTLGLHSYLGYLRDRLLVARELLHVSGSAFVQISDTNLHHVLELLDEVFGAENRVAIIPFVKTSGLAVSGGLTAAVDYIVWCARDRKSLKSRTIFSERTLDNASSTQYSWIELSDGTRRRLTAKERRDSSLIPEDAKRYRFDNLTKPGPGSKFEFPFDGKLFTPGRRWWGTTPEGMESLARTNRLQATDKSLYYVRFWNDFAFRPFTNLWTDTAAGGFAEDRLYVVQTGSKVIERCVWMATDPGDLVLDPTCGSGTTAYVAEKWGRRWITIDTSRVPIALARQRLLTAIFPYYELRDVARGPAAGFVYKRRRNRNGREVGGLVPHITLKTIANGDPPNIETLVDRPEVVSNVSRVTGPFAVEAMIAPVQPLEQGCEGSTQHSDVSTHVERMTEVLRQSKTLQLPGNRILRLDGIRRTSDMEFIHAEAAEGDNRIAIVFGPEDGAISSLTVYEAAREGHYLKYDRVYFFGFAIQAKAREMVEDAKRLRIPAAYVAVTPDVAMADLLKTNRASEIFSITGLPDFRIRPLNRKGNEGEALCEVELLGLDIFDPETLESESIDGHNVPCWMLDTDYDGMCFYASQVFFPRTSAWDNLQRSLGATFDESVWDHLAGTVSEPFAAGERRRVAVKVVDERGNELLRVKDLEG